jgi:type I restriction enzyme S subunit
MGIRVAINYPTHWQVTPLDQCIEALIDYRGKSPEKTTSGIPLVTAKIVKDGRISQPHEFIAVEDYDEWMRRGIPKPGDVVLTTEAPLGEVAQLDERKVALAQRIITLRGKPNILDNDYLKYFLLSDEGQSQLHSRATGTTVSGIRQSELRRIQVVLPPINEQRSIAHILGTLDKKIHLNRRQNETLEAMARALFKSWFVDFDPVRAKVEGRESGLSGHLADLFPMDFEDSERGEIPRGWRVQTIGGLAEVLGGSTPSTKEPRFWEGGTHYWATPKDLSGLASPILLESERRITDAGLAQIGSGLLPKGTILLSSRAPIGYLAIAEVPVAINQGFIAMIPKPGVSNIFLLLWASLFHDEIVSRANGSTFLEISKSSFRPIPVVAPPASLMAEFDQHVQPIYNQIAANERENRTLVTTRDLLLPRLLSGELAVNAVGSITGGGS